MDVMVNAETGEVRFFLRESLGSPWTSKRKFSPPEMGEMWTLLDDAQAGSVGEQVARSLGLRRDEYDD